MVDIVIATEDELSEAVAQRIASEAGFHIAQSIRRNGQGYLKQKMRSFSEIARRKPVLVLTDLDRVGCPQALVANWMAGVVPNRNLLLRVVVREIESWVMADEVAMRRLLGRGARGLALDPENLADPKAELLRRARLAPREVRSDLLPSAGAVASQGLGYNQRLVSVVLTHWDPERAALRSQSLTRARARLREIAQ